MPEVTVSLFLGIFILCVDFSMSNLICGVFDLLSDCAIEVLVALCSSIVYEMIAILTNIAQLFVPCGSLPSWRSKSALSYNTD